MENKIIPIASQEHLDLAGYNQAELAKTRFLQNGDSDTYRGLNPNEINALEGNLNKCSDWSKVLVQGSFHPELFVDNTFSGVVRIKEQTPACLQHKNLKTKIGIYQSIIISADIGANCAIHHVTYLAHYILKDQVILHNIDEIQCAPDARFGLGIIRPNQSEEDRIWIEISNEIGSRACLAHPGMTPSDAFLFYDNKSDKELQEKLVSLTQQSYELPLGSYGVIESHCTIKSVKFISNTVFGEGVYVKGANKLKNIWINSNTEHPVQIGEGCELVNGVMHIGSKAFYGVKAVRFVLGQNANLKYGARLINSILGDNSNISCCEVLNSLIYPNHEQHHNNSFLVAGTYLGQSNMAAGATIGSNHNSRANDGEILAGRGFWPGLSVSLKHNSKFASFNLLAKGSYPAELDIPFPFSLISNNETANELTIYPGYWFQHNMYALERNSWKFANRDNRPDKSITLEFDYMAPDTINEIIQATQILAQVDEDGYLPTEAYAIENSKRGIKVLRAKEAIQHYKNQLIRYACLLFAKQELNLTSLKELQTMAGKKIDWVNVGGQLIPEDSYNLLKTDIKNGTLFSWETIKKRQVDISKQNLADKSLHALWALEQVGLIGSTITTEELNTLVEVAQTCTSANNKGVKQSRNKDFTNHFRHITTKNEDEFEAIYGRLEKTSFIQFFIDDSKIESDCIQTLKESITPLT